MKKMAIVVVLLLILTGCRSTDHMMNQAVSVRQSVLEAKTSAFDCIITADYGDDLYSFTLQCEFDSVGNMVFQVIEPESIRGISGQIQNHNGKLIFNDQALAFPLLADGYISPVSAPWVFMKALRSGYINSCTKTEEGITISVDDSYEENALNVQIWTYDEGAPYYAEFLWQGRRILTMGVSNFSCM